MRGGGAQRVGGEGGPRGDGAGKARMGIEAGRVDDQGYIFSWLHGGGGRVAARRRREARQDGEGSAGEEGSWDGRTSRRANGLSLFTTQGGSKNESKETIEA